MDFTGMSVQEIAMASTVDTFVNVDMIAVARGCVNRVTQNCTWDAIRDVIDLTTFVVT